MMILLGCMDIDLALRMPKPDELNEQSTQEDEVYWGKWERSNRLSLMIMKRGIPEAFRGAVTDEVTNASDFLAEIQKRFAKNDKAETSTLLASLISMKYKGKGNVREYIMEMSHLASKLKALKLELSDDLLVHLEERLKQDKTESAHLASTSKDKGKRKNKDNKVAASNGPEQKKQKVEILVLLLTFVFHAGCLSYRKPSDAERCIYVGDGEQRPGPFAKYLEECGIVPQYTMPGSPSMNGVAEDETEPLRTWMLSWGRNQARNIVFEEEEGSTIAFDNVQVSLPIIDQEEREVESGMMEDDPINFQQAMKSSNSQKWIEAMNEEYKSMQDNKVWELVPLPVGTKPIGCKWIFKTKRDSNGNVERYKARLVAKGFTQKEGIDFKETFSPVSTKDSFRIIMALVAHYDLELHQMDIKTAFLNGDIDETIYMQASRQWYFKFHQIIVSYGFEANLMDECVYHKFSGRIQIHRDRSRGILGLSQRTYIDKVLQRSQEMQKIPYASAVGSLMYAQVCTRPDIAYIVGMLGRYLSNPGMDHWRAAKRVMRYLQRTKEYMLTYRRLDQLELIGYSDSDFAGCQDSRRSTSGYIYLLAGGAISWRSAKQTLVTSSTMEAEFVACYEASNQGIWLRNFVTGLRVLDGIERPLKIFCVNKSAVLYSNNNRSSTKSKYIDIKFLVVKEKVQSGQISIEHIGTNSMIADPLTKGLPPKVFHEHTAHMGVVSFEDIQI
ncbi:Retrovirus-related Pol polyprotein from transposon TNT 1-94 [Vitis vinifera]|uniref:Retrovirus-related Pol polyprotein from transposon TNT 1-94 n=1 Tax=Vitis vinifera TaxID=29760 RepID=A0A438HL55_VITVI|nr:Retrovirus-related Pol polyprotein from transposon TNT 1-94 [Vitis vinifera]